MDISREKRESYQKNLWSLQEVTDKLLGYMKGWDWSFRKEITDRKGRVSQEKLCGLVEILLSRWEEEVRNGTDTDPATGESVAEPYLRARRELYGAYLYLAMRCSLIPGAYNACCGGSEERPDFTFLMEQAKWLSQSWCVMAEPDGSKRNELIRGFDAHFGFHLYHVLSDLKRKLTPDYQTPEERLDSMTDEGNRKRIFYRRLSPVTATAEIAAEEESEPEEEYDWDVPEDSEPEDGLWYTEEDDEAAGLRNSEMELEWLAEEGARLAFLESLAFGIDAQEEYLAACERFVALFQQAGPEVLRDFYEELEQIVNLYLAQREIAPLADTDKTLNIYGRVFDGPYRQAKRYARGIQWNNL